MRSSLKFLIAFGLLILSMSSAKADDVGIFVRPPNKIAAPVANKTFTFDPTDGALKGYDGSSWQNKTLPKINLTATTGPVVTDDEGDGYAVGSFWLDTVGAQFYVCTDASTGAAEWAVFTSGAVSSTDLENAVKVKLTFADVFSDFLVSGFNSTDPGATLSMTTPLGVAYVSGNRVNFTATGYTYTASKDTYDYLQANGTTNHIAVNNLASAPTGQPGLLLQKVVTNGSEITAVTKLGPAAPIFTVGNATQDNQAISKGQADDLYAPISITESQSQAYIYGVSDSAPGLPGFRLLTNGHLPIVDPAHGGLGTAITLNSLGLFYSNGTTGALTAEPAPNEMPIANPAGTGWTYINKNAFALIGGNGADGAVSKTESDDEATVKQFNCSTFVLAVTPGNDYRLKSGSGINATGTVDINGYLVVDGDMPGGFGSENPNVVRDGSGVSPGRGPHVLGNWAGGGGGGCFGAGGDGGSDTTDVPGGLGGPRLGLQPGLSGSGGSAGEGGPAEAGGDGGYGGGTATICARGRITIAATTGAIYCSGFNGESDLGAGGAGGSGGIARLYSAEGIDVLGSVNCVGGAGGDGGQPTYGAGAGGGGGAALLMSPDTDYSGGSINVSGGAAGSGGTQAATSGVVGTVIDIVGTPSMPLIALHDKYMPQMVAYARSHGGGIFRWSKEDNIQFLAALESNGDNLEFVRICNELRDAKTLDIAFNH